MAKKIQVITKGKGTKARKFAILPEGFLLYGRFAEPSLKPKSKKDKIFSTDLLLLSADAADEFEDMFPENMVRYIPCDMFEDIYKIDPDTLDPEPEVVEEKPNKFPSSIGKPQQAKLKKKAVDCYIVLSLTCNALATRGIAKAFKISEGDVIPEASYLRPKLLLEQEDGKPINITTTKSAGNGSLAVVSVRITEDEDGIQYPKLSDTLVKDLIEYESEGGNESGVFGAYEDDDHDEDGDDQGGAFGGYDEDDEDETPKQRSRRRRSLPKSSPKSEEPDDEDQDDDDGEDEPPKRTRRKPSRKKQPDPEPEEDEQDDDFDGFDEEDEEDEEDEPPKRTRRKSSTKKPAKPVPEDDDEDEDDDDIPY